MKISMCIQESWEVYNRLLRLYQRMEQLVDCMKKQRLRLSEEEVMQDLEYIVRKKEKEMKEQLEFLRCMRLALEQILYCYEREIKGMEEHLEGGRLNMSTAKVEKVQVQAVKQMLKQLE